MKTLRLIQKISGLFLILILAQNGAGVWAQNISVTEQNFVPTLPLAKDAGKKTSDSTKGVVTQDPGAEFFTASPLLKASSKETLYEAVFGGGQLILEANIDKKGISKIIAKIQVPDPSAKGGVRAIETFNVGDYALFEDPGGSGILPSTTVLIAALDGKLIALTSYEDHSSDHYEIFEGAKSGRVPFIVSRYFAWSNAFGFQKAGESLLNGDGVVQLTNFFYDNATGKKNKEVITWYGDADGKINGKVARLTKNFTPAGIEYSVRVDTGSTAPEDLLFETALTDIKFKSSRVAGLDFITELTGKAPDGSGVKIIINKDDIRVV